MMQMLKSFFRKFIFTPLLCLIKFPSHRLLQICLCKHIFLIMKYSIYPFNVCIQKKFPHSLHLMHEIFIAAVCLKKRMIQNKQYYLFFFWILIFYFLENKRESIFIFFCCFLRNFSIFFLYLF